MQKSLQRQCEDNRRPPSKSGPTDSTAPAKDHDSDQRSCDGRWKARAEIALTEDSVACHLRPIGERGFIETKLIVEVREDVIAALGPPDDEDELTLSYALPTRVGYLYSFSFADDSHPRRLRSSGFRRVDGRGTANVDATARRELPRKLAEAGATADEVRSWLGSPAREYGWWPVEAWEYPDGLILQLRHAVVEA